VAVATNWRGSSWNPSNAALRIPPWFPTRPPKNPEAAPPRSRQAGVWGSGTRRSKTSLVPATTSSEARTTVRTELPSRGWRRAPVKPPTALETPNCRKVGRCTSVRRRSQRNPVATACGIARIATAWLAGIERSSRGVSRLPRPKPDTAATAPARIAAVPMSQGDSTMSAPR
jgi:hypothetical protein